MAISQSAVFGIAFALVAFRAKGILRRLRLTPMPLGEFAAARVLMALCLALSQAVVLLAVGHFAFGVTIAGNLLSLVPLVGVGALCFIAIGLLVGSVAKTEDAAAAMANLVTLPMTFLAGVFFPLDSAPGRRAGRLEGVAADLSRDGLRGVAVRDHSFAWTLPKLGVLRGVRGGDRRGVAAELPLDVAVTVSPVVVPWASQYYAPGMQEGPDAVLGALGAGGACRGCVACRGARGHGGCRRPAPALPFALLGECTLVPGFVAGALRRWPDACVIWVDAHGDLNTPATSHLGVHRGDAVCGDRRVVGLGAPGRVRSRAGRRGACCARRGARSRCRARRRCSRRRRSSWRTMLRGRLPALPAEVPIVMHVDGDILDPAVAPGVDVPAADGWDVARLRRRWPLSVAPDVSWRSACAVATRVGTSGGGACGPTCSLEPLLG